MRLIENPNESLTIWLSIKIMHRLQKMNPSEIESFWMAQVCFTSESSFREELKMNATTNEATLSDDQHNEAVEATAGTRLAQNSSSPSFRASCLESSRSATSSAPCWHWPNYEKNLTGELT